MLNDIWGAIDREEGLILEAFVRCLKPKCVIETGTGFSTYFIAKALDINDNDGQMFVFEGNQERIEEVKRELTIDGLNIRCTFVHGNSIDNLTKLRGDYPEVNFSFIDSDHHFDHVSTELEFVYKSLSPNGVIIGHDSILDPGAGRAYRAFAAKYNLSRITIHTGRGLDIIQ